jgi:hypothetical protein
MALLSKNTSSLLLSVCWIGFIREFCPLGAEISKQLV